MNNYFFISFLPRDFGSLSKSEIRHLSPKLAKYLYITSLSRILSSLEENKQIDFLEALNISEEEAKNWISRSEETQTLLKEHLERTLLSVRA